MASLWVTFRSAAVIGSRVTRTIITVRHVVSRSQSDAVGVALDSTLDDPLAVVLRAGRGAAAVAIVGLEVEVIEAHLDQLIGTREVWSWTSVATLRSLVDENIDVNVHVDVRVAIHVATIAIRIPSSRR